MSHFKSRASFAPGGIRNEIQSAGRFLRDKQGGVRERKAAQRGRTLEKFCAMHKIRPRDVKSGTASPPKRPRYLKLKENLPNK
jgi:hypothetical protein